MKTLLLLLSFSPLMLSQKAEKPAAAEPPVFADEFNGSELDLSRWAPHDPRLSPGDPQSRAYAPESVSVGGGQLHILARLPARRGQNSQVPVSGIVSTFGAFAQRYGRFEIRCRLPAGPGLRPRFLLLPAALGSLPSIDVFETRGSAPSKIFFATHWGTEQTERSFAGTVAMPDLATGFHTITLDWEPEKIVWSVDGKQKFQTVDGVPAQPMYLLLELAVTGDASAALTASFDIDYIRVYNGTRQSTGAPVPVK